MDDSGETTGARARHVAFYVELAERAEPGLTGPNQLVWLDRLQAERHNLLAALEWSTVGSDP